MRSLFLLLLALFAVAAPAQAPDAERSAEAVKDFKKYYRSYKEPSQKVEAIYTLRAHESLPAMQELVQLLDNKESAIRDAAVEVLSGYTRDETFAGLVVELPEQKNQERRAQIVTILGRAGIKSALPALHDLVLVDKRSDTQVKVAVANALGRMGNHESVPALNALLTDADPLVRMAAADAAGTLRIGDLGKKLLPLLDDSAWQVQSAAIQALGKVRLQDAVVPLIGVLRKPGRLREEAADALFRITAMDLGMDPDLWQKQWNTLTSIEGYRIPTDGELQKAAESRKRNNALYGNKADATTFASIPTSSTRVLFIIDVSGSMEDQVTERDKFTGYADLQKFTIVRTELLRTIENLGPNTEFNIAAFATGLKTFKKFLVPANIVNKSAAAAWVERLGPIGGSQSQKLASAGLGGAANLEAGKTNTYLALMYAFGIDPEKDDPRNIPAGAALKNKLDTVYFLSDGRPSTGKQVDTREILKDVKSVNEQYRLVIHAIAIGEFQKEFMEDLAAQNGGVFVDLGR